MIVQIDLVVLDPDRIGKLQRHRRELAGEHRHQVKALGHLAPEVVVEVALVAGRQRIAAQRPHVLRRVGGLYVQKGSVQSAYGLQVAYSSDGAPCRQVRLGGTRDIRPEAPRRSKLTQIISVKSRVGSIRQRWRHDSLAREWRRHRQLPTRRRASRDRARREPEAGAQSWTGQPWPRMAGTDPRHKTEAS